MKSKSKSPGIEENSYDMLASTVIARNNNENSEGYDLAQSIYPINSMSGKNSDDLSTSNVNTLSFHQSDSGAGPEPEKKTTINLVEDFSIIKTANLFQYAITAYSSLQHVTKNIFGFEIPNISNSYAIPLHIGTTLCELSSISATYAAYNNAHPLNRQDISYKTIFIKTLPTILYLTKIGISEMIIKPMIGPFFTEKNEGNFCAAHAATQFIIDRAGEEAHHFVTGVYSPASVLYGTAYTAIYCIGKDNTELSNYEKATSSVISILSGGLMGAYLHYTLPTGYTNLNIFGNAIKTISSVAIVNKLINAAFTAKLHAHDDEINNKVVKNVLINASFVANIAQKKSFQKDNLISKNAIESHIKRDGINENTSENLPVVEQMQKNFCQENTTPYNPAVELYLGGEINNCVLIYCLI